MGISKEQLFNAVNKLKAYVDKKSSTNNLTNDLKSQYDNAAAKAHTHANKDTLDKLSSTSDGELLYDGTAVRINITIDNMLDDTSENPVQNKAIKKYIDDNLSEGFGDISEIIDKINRVVI